MQQFTTTTDKK